MGLDSNIYLVGTYEPRHIGTAMRNFLETHRGNTIKVDKRHYRITIDGKEYYFLPWRSYDRWCLGRTYWWGDKLYHSDYVVEEKVHEDRIDRC